MHLRAPASRRAPTIATMLAAQLVDGLGGRLHAVLLTITATQIGGISGLSKFTAANLAGGVLAAVLTNLLARRVSGRGMLAGAAGALTAARLCQYLVVWHHGGIAAMAAVQLVSSLCGTTMMQASKAQASLGEHQQRPASSSLAWMNAVNATGGVVGAGVASLLSMSAPAWLLVAAGATVAGASSIPMLRFALRTTVAATPAKMDLATYRRIAPSVLLASSVSLCVAGLPLLRDGLVVELYHEGWVAPLAAAAVVGNMFAAAILRRVASRSGSVRTDAVVWPLLGVLGLLGWAVVDRGVLFLVLAQVVAGFAGQLLGALTEARVTWLAGPERATAALSASVASASLVTSGAVLVLPVLLSSLGYGGFVALAAMPLLLLSGLAALYQRVTLPGRAALYRRPRALAPTEGDRVLVRT